MYSLPRRLTGQAHPQVGSAPKPGPTRRGTAERAEIVQQSGLRGAAGEPRLPSPAGAAGQGGKVPLYRAGLWRAYKETWGATRLTQVHPSARWNKMSLVVSVLQLVERGNISLEDTSQVSALAPCAPKSCSRRIKPCCRHAGWQLFHDDGRSLRARFRPWTTVCVVKNASLQFEPGTRWSYSTPRCWCSEGERVVPGDRILRVLRERSTTRRG